MAPPEKKVKKKPKDPSEVKEPKPKKVSKTLPITHKVSGTPINKESFLEGVDALLDDVKDILTRNPQNPLVAQFYAELDSNAKARRKALK